MLKYVKYDNIFTNGKVVMKSAYSLNCKRALSFGNNNCKLPAKCPIKNKHKNKPVAAIQYFLNKDDLIKTEFTKMIYVLNANLTLNNLKNNMKCSYFN